MPDNQAPRRRTQTARERVQSALKHEQPERAPFSWGLYPTPEMNTVMEDYLRNRGISWRALFNATEDSMRITPRYIGPVLPANTDIWGIVRKAISYGTGSYDEFEVYPLANAKTVEEINAYPWPDPDWFDYNALPNDILRIDPEGRLADKLWIDVCGNILEIYTWMTGHEVTFTNLALHPELVQAGLEHITNYFAQKMRQALPLVKDRVDICYFADDLGGQKSLLMSRRMYREVIMPFHQRLFRLAKELAPHAAIMLHSDGTVFDLLPDLIEAGVEVLEAVQVDAAKMDPQALKDTFGDRIAFHGGISVQALLPHTHAQTVEVECQRLVQVFGKGGGYIAAPTHCVQVGTPPENVLAMLRGVLGESEYQEIIDQARLESFQKTLSITQPHLFLPVKNGAEQVLMQLIRDGEVVREFAIELATVEAVDWWAYYDVSVFHGLTLVLQTVEPCIPHSAIARLDQSVSLGEGLRDAEDLYQERYRPQFHFTPKRGWNNDPNGLVYLNGSWHMFFQYNPFGINWGNMHWGHAVSHDLLHWRELPVALFQKTLLDMAFSGSAIMDRKNKAGFNGQDTSPTMVLAFTSTGRGECLAYSLDDGQTFTEYTGNPVIQHTGRDPKIIWYEPGNKWVMIAYEEVENASGDMDHGYAFYDSRDLKSWQRTDFLPGYYECPELFELPVEGTQERYWVIYGARWEGEKSVFLIGTFEGKLFNILEGPTPAHYGPHFYAAQTFNYAPQRRRIMLGWLAGAVYRDMPFSQGMTVPLELSLRRTTEGLRLCFYPVKELDQLKQTSVYCENPTLAEANATLKSIQADLLDIHLKIIPQGNTPIQLEIGGYALIYEPVSRLLHFAGSQARLSEDTTELDLRVLVDRSVTEVFAQGGLAAFSAMTIFPPGVPKIKLKGKMKVNEVEVFSLKSIWEGRD